MASSCFLTVRLDAMIVGTCYCCSPGRCRESRLVKVKLMQLNGEILEDKPDTVCNGGSTSQRVVVQVKDNDPKTESQGIKELISVNQCRKANLNQLGFNAVKKRKVVNFQCVEYCYRQCVIEAVSSRLAEKSGEVAHGNTRVSTV